MTIFWIFFALIHLLSIGFALFAVYRLYGYIHAYRMPESKYTLLFRFIRLRYLATAYLILTAVFFVWSSISLLVT